MSKKSESPNPVPGLNKYMAQTAPDLPVVSAQDLKKLKKLTAQAVRSKSDWEKIFGIVHGCLVFTGEPALAEGMSQGHILLHRGCLRVFFTPEDCGTYTKTLRDSRPELGDFWNIHSFYFDDVVEYADSIGKSVLIGWKWDDQEGLMYNHQTGELQVGAVFFNRSEMWKLVKERRRKRGAEGH